jgi:hypothetical protein
VAEDLDAEDLAEQLPGHLAEGLVSGAFLAWPARSASATGSAAMTVSHLGHSVLPILIAIGPPSV